MNSRKLYLMIILVFATVVQCCHGKQFGYKLDGHSLRTIYRISHEQCYRECSARSPCLSYTYHFRSHSCFLSRVNEVTPGVNIAKTAGYVYASKASWSGTDPECSPECAAEETCMEHKNCKTTECSPVTVGNNAHVRGNMLAIGSRILHVCNYDDTQMHQSTCLDTGIWSPTPDMVCPDSADPVETAPAGAVSSGSSLFTGELEGHLFRIHSKATGRFWHDDGWGDNRISSRYQSNDKFVKFSFLQQNDGSYKIGVRTTFVYDSYGTSNILSTSVISDPDSTKFFVTIEASGDLRIRAKRNGRLVRMDEDEFVSTRYDIDDELSTFYLVKI